MDKQTKKKAIPMLRSYQSSKSGRLFQSFEESFSVNADIQGGAWRVRSRARALVNDDGFAESIIKLLKNNIVGADGFKFSSQAKNNDGSLDAKANDTIEALFKKWCKVGNCTVEGNLSFTNLLEMILENVAIDGEVLAVLRRGSQFGIHEFQIDMIPIDQLDDTYYTLLENGNVVFQGVEINQYFRPQAYHVLQRSRNDPAGRLIPVSGENFRIRIPAEDCIHLFCPRHFKQVRGLSWLVAALVPIHSLNELSKAELEMARLATIKRMVYKVQAGADFEVGEEEIDFLNQSINRDLDSASVDVLPQGVDMEALDWKESKNENGSLAKRELRKVAGGMGLSYNSIAKDLESVSYSAGRIGQLEDRATFKQKQNWLIDHFIQPVYEKWLAWMIVKKRLPFGLDKLDKFIDGSKWTAKGFESADPQKDAKAYEILLSLGLTSRSEIMANSGKDFEEVLNEQVREELAIKAAYEKAGLDAPTYFVTKDSVVNMDSPEKANI